MSASETIPSSAFRKIVFQHTYFLLSRALDFFELQHYNIAVFFAITAIEEIANNLYNVKSNFRERDFKNFMVEFIPLSHGILKEDIQINDETMERLTEILNKYIKREENPEELSIKHLISKFKMKEHKNHKKKTLKSLFNSISIHPKAYRKLGGGLIDYFIFLAEKGLILNFRNRCLYITIVNNVIFNPEEVIPKNMAVDFISIAFESIIILKNIGRNYYSEDDVRLPDELKLREKADDFYIKNNFKPISYVGMITNFLNKINVIIVEVINEVSNNDELVIFHPSALTQWKQLDKVISIEKDHVKINKAIAGDTIGIKIKNKTLKYGLLFKVQDDIGVAQKKGIMQLTDLLINTAGTGDFPDQEKINKLLNLSIRGIEW